MTLPFLDNHLLAYAVGSIGVLVEWRAYSLHCDQAFRRWVSLLPAFAVSNTTLALFYLDKHSMRIAMLASSLAWLANDVYWQAWPALLAESVAMLINLRTIRQLVKK
jgi:hypothetical protein